MFFDVLVSETCLITISEVLFLNFLQGHSSKYLFFWSLVLLSKIEFFLSVFTVECSVAGNPLICKNSLPEICSGSISASPLSVSLRSSSGKSILKFNNLARLFVDCLIHCLWVRYHLGCVGRRTNILAVALGVSLGFAVSVILSLGFIWYRKKQRRLTMLRISG